MSSAALDSGHFSSSHGENIQDWLDDAEGPIHGDPTRLGRSGQKRAKKPRDPLPVGTVFAERYRVVRCLGIGGFSEVYLTNDLQLGRRVAVKRTFAMERDSEFTLKEAKTVAALDHPGIVRIFDIIRDETFGLLIVMQFVNGANLQSHLKKTRLSVWRAVEIAKSMAIAASHAHAHGIVHRDIKPANILIDQSENPLLTDFGLAWRRNLDQGPIGRSGTVRYMSPEQMRGETHRIDARSDVFSLGIVLYEMLAEGLPFVGRTFLEVKESTINAEPTPLTKINLDVPIELDRICRRAMRKSVKDRFSTMAEFAEALQKIQTDLPRQDSEQKTHADTTKGLDSRSTDSLTIQRDLIVPRGLQPYQQTDGDWFLELVPGARHPIGLPESIYAWKQWIESEDSRETSRLGVLYGAPGSGKTSFVQAGILANLDNDIAAVTVECRAAKSMTARISRAIVTQLGLASGDDNLVELINRLRIEETIESEHRKVLIVLDQFEDWAQRATKAQFDQLGAALRQCDGTRVQVLVVVGEEHWANVTVLGNTMDVPLIEGKNFRPMVLLSSQQARRILELMGRSFGSLPPAHESLDDQQVGFLSRAIDELGRDHGGRILPVQIAIFAQMAEMHDWNPRLLEQAGGLDGLYVQYFEDQFESETASSKNKELLPIVADLLSQLLPAPDQSVRDGIVVQSELEQELEASYSPIDIDRAICLLAEEVKVVVVTTRENDAGDEDAKALRISNDFLVEPIKTWTERVTKSTPRGRAIAKLTELCGMWERRHERRFFPSMLEYLNILSATWGMEKTPVQQEFMRGAARLHWSRIGYVMSVVVLAIAMIQSIRSSLATNAAETLNTQISLLLNGDASQVAEAIEQLLQHPDRGKVTWHAYQRRHTTEWNLRCLLLQARLESNHWLAVIEQLDEFEDGVGAAVIRGIAEEPSFIQDLETAYLDVESSYRLRIRAAITLHYLGHSGPVRELLDFDNDPALSYETVSEAAKWRDVSMVEAWIPLLDEEAESTPYCVAAILGSFPRLVLEEKIPRWEMPLRRLLRESYPRRQCIKWLYRQAGAELPPLPLETADESEWYPTRYGFDMVRIDVGPLPEFYSGLLNGVRPVARPLVKPSGNERFWIASQFVSAGLAIEYLQSQEIPLPPQLADAVEGDPARGLTKVQIVRFCNWLSEREGLEPAYQIELKGSRLWITSIAGNNGYRLPNSEELLSATVADSGTIPPFEAAKSVYVGAGRKYAKGKDDNDRGFVAFFPNSLGIHCTDDGFQPILVLPDLRFDGSHVIVKDPTRLLSLMGFPNGGFYSRAFRPEAGRGCLLLARSD